MKIFFNNEYSAKEIYFDNLIIFHGNINNQINLYNELIKGLQGNSKSFLLNNQPVNKKELNVIEFSSNNIFDDLKLSSKSYNLKILESILDDEDEIIQSLNQVVNELEFKIRDIYKFVIPEYGELSPSIYFQNLRKLIIDNFSLVEKGKINISLQIELQLMVILNYIKQNPNTFFYVMIKHFNHCLDISQMTYILNNYKNTSNVATFVFVKSFELFEYYPQCVNYMINDLSVKKMKSFKDELSLSKLLTMEENIKLNEYLTANQRYIEYSKTVNEKI